MAPCGGLFIGLELDVPVVTFHLACDPLWMYSLHVHYVDTGMVIKHENLATCQNPLKKTLNGKSGERRCGGFNRASMD